ncbi:MAG: phytanoyl-CoA dioxygenase family protein [Synechococcaceae cyanobacterium]
MTIDFQAVAPIDRPDFHELLAEGVFGRWKDQALCLHTLGYCTLPVVDAAFLGACEAVIAAYSKRLQQELVAWEAGQAGPPRVQDGWQELEAVRQLSLHPEVLDLLSVVYGRRAFPFQTLNFAVGSQQTFHSDAVHFHSEPHGFLCGLWIPLADVTPDSGPLVYYPGSHRLPYLSASSLGLSPEQVAAEPHPQVLFEPTWHEAVERLGIKPHHYLPRRGELLFWHANLLHGGSPVRNRSARRWSQVVHYFFDDCLHTTPLDSFPLEQGGPRLRNPRDISTGQRLWSAEAWSALDLTSMPFVQQSQAISDLRTDAQAGMAQMASGAADPGGEAAAGQP